MAVTLAYTVFGLTGFGAAMVAVPILVQAMPLQDVVPLVLLLDLVCTPIIGFGNRSRVALPELARIVPFMFVGVVIGVTLLSKLSPQPMLIALGVFVLATAVRGLLYTQHSQAVIGTRWAAPAGVVGGVFGALFGTGGPIYTLYLARRLIELDEFRATISMTILVSALLRLAAFTATGTTGHARLWLTAAFALPFCLGGLWAGTRLRRRVNAQTLRRMVFALLAVSGVGVLYRVTVV